MNTTLILKILMMLPGLVTTVETLVKDKGTGVAKLETVINAITPLVPEEQFPEFTSSVLPRIKGFVGTLVALYNLTGLFRK